ncbi:MAG: bifunctional DNA-formamidopyrimidine glycosylase/DNA-(apurinic or apyrimidinic site) lyase [Bdellovibrionales bacterium]
MPELPEVEIVRRGIEGTAFGRRVEGVIYYRADLRYPLPVDLPALLKGRRFESFQRRGKYILAFTDHGHGFVLHLGMSGVIKIIPAGEAYSRGKHDHVEFCLDDGARLMFNDPRRFGFLRAARRDDWAAQKPFDTMGPEPLGNDFNGPALWAALAGRKTPIKTALLDQGVVAGLGNIYVCEALFMAGIDPRRFAGDLSLAECDVLAGAIVDVLQRAIESGGSSLRDYYHADGSLGYFQHSFQVYDREGHACPRCQSDSAAVLRMKQAGRSSFYCPSCQV